MVHHPGNLFVVAAPSGAGKSSLVNALLEIDNRLSLSISHTTRRPRGQEEDGREYYFVSDQVFDQMVQGQEFLEWAKVHQHKYGTSKKTIHSLRQQAKDVILELDYQGALQVQNIFTNAVLIFILPPSWRILRERLLRRGEDSRVDIDRRLQNAAIEMQYAKAFDFVIINDRFEQAVFDLKSIVQSHRLKYNIQKIVQADIFQSLKIIQPPLHYLPKNKEIYGTYYR
jgi:guanylate kinase